MLFATSPESLVVNLNELNFYGLLRIIFKQLLYENINTNKQRGFIIEFYIMFEEVLATYKRKDSI
jgi:hypothetical protein